MKMTGQTNHHNTKNKIKTKQEIKFQHNCAQRAFAHLQMSPHLLHSSHLKFDNFHCGEKQNETCSRSELKGSNDSIADDGSVSDNKLCENGATFLENNATENMFQTRTTILNRWIWMETKNITTELKWTYLD